MIIISFSICVIIPYWFMTYTGNDNWKIFSHSFIFIMGIFNLISSFNETINFISTKYGINHNNWSWGLAH